MRVLHLWDNYAPGLFDRSFEICRSEGYDTRLLCMNFIGRGQAKPAGVAAVRPGIPAVQLLDSHSLHARALS